MDLARYPAEHDRLRDAHDGVADEDEAIRRKQVEPTRSQHTDGYSRDECSGGGRDRAGKVVSSEYRGSATAGRDFAERRLFHREERSDLVSRRAEHADRGRQKQHWKDIRCGEHESGGGHQHCAADEYPSPADPIGVGRQPQADADVAHERQAQDQAHGRAIQAQGRQIEDEDDCQPAVGEHP
jgi:hypothetical protein